jgi:hypothetical protein
MLRWEFICVCVTVEQSYAVDYVYGSLIVNLHKQATLERVTGKI